MREAWAARFAALGALCMVLVAGAGCSWVRETTGWGESEAPARPEPPGLERPYPNLSTVPNRTPDAGTTRERLRIEEGLLADRQNARHTPGPVAGEDRPSSLPPDTGARTIIFSPPTQAEIRAAAARPQQQVGRIGSINYSANSASLPEGSGRLIVQAAEAQRRFGGTVVVVGHASASEGDTAARRDLAARRAQVIANGLINLGVDRGNIRVVPGGADASRVDITLVVSR